MTGGARAKEYEDLLLRSSVGAQRERLRNTMMRMFPVLEAVWENRHYGGDFGRQWASERRVRSASHFDAYFRFAVGAEVLAAAELDALIARAHDSAFIAAEMRSAGHAWHCSKGTKAAVILDEINLHAERVDKAHVQPLLTGLFAAHEINVEARPRSSSAWQAMKCACIAAQPYQRPFYAEPEVRHLRRRMPNSFVGVVG